MRCYLFLKFDFKPLKFILLDGCVDSERLYGISNWNYHVINGYNTFFLKLDFVYIINSVPVYVLNQTGCNNIYFEFKTILIYYKN